MVDALPPRFEHYGHGKAEDAIVGLGGQVYLASNSQDAVREFRPYFDNAPVYGHGPSLEEFTAPTPLTVGSPEQVVERTLRFREYAGNYQRQLFLVDHAGLPLDDRAATSWTCSARSSPSSARARGRAVPEPRDGSTPGT